MSVRVQSAPFDFGAEASGFAAGRQDVGAIVTFSGIVRAPDGDPDGRMTIEHYPGMTERALEQIRTEALQRFALKDALIIHRYGELRAGEPIMMVATAAPHRADAFSGAEFLMDFLKSCAPFWKKEHSARGAGWVAAAESDDRALARWTEGD